MNENRQQITMTPIKSTWFTQMTSIKIIGIVAGLNEETGEVKTYIGIADGYNEEQDAQLILNTGTEISSIDITNFIISANLLAQILLDKSEDT